jgi:hypothetical protein
VRGCIVAGVAGVAASLAVASPLGAQQDCPRIDLPAYAHNDYYNARPLFDALSLGYRGVEADVFLIDGELRVGHDRGEARRGGTLETMYVAPLAELARRCHWIVAQSDPFLLNVELKQSSRAAFDSLASLIGRYGDAFTFSDSSHTERRAVTLVLVGWHPPRAQMRRREAGFLWEQIKFEQPDERIPANASPYVRLISIDYGKTIGRAAPALRERWRENLASHFSVWSWVRVYDVPPDSTIYRFLRSTRVALIGTRELRRTRELLLPLVRLSRCYALETGPWVVSDSTPRQLYTLPRQIRLDSNPAKYFFADLPSYHSVAALDTATWSSRLPWAWMSRLGMLRIIYSSGFVGADAQLAVNGDSVVGQVSMFADAVDDAHPEPHAPVRGRAIECP